MKNNSVLIGAKELDNDEKYSICSGWRLVRGTTG